MNDLVSLQMPREYVAEVCGQFRSGCHPTSAHLQGMVLESSHRSRHLFGELLDMQLIVFKIISILGNAVDQLSKYSLLLYVPIDKDV